MELDERIGDDASNHADYESPLSSHRHPQMLGSLKKSSFRSRWLILVLCCILMSSNYYAYDIPSALHQQIQTYMPPSSNFETKFNLLYTAYSIPNTILPLFGGNVVDRYGAPKCQTLFAIIIFLGSCILSMGVSSQSWQLMYFGRFIFGLGAESLSVAQSTVLSEWFEGREVALAMGIALSVSRLGSIWNNLISPKVANAKNGGVETAFWLGALLTSTAVVTGFLIVFVDTRAKRKIERRTGGGLESLTAALLEGTVVESDFIQTGGRPGNDAVADEADNHESETVHISDIRKFKPLFWLLSLSCVVVYGCVLPFNNVASGILLERNFFTSPPDCHLTYEDQCTDGCK
jgi:MFS family permease